MNPLAAEAAKRRQKDRAVARDKLKLKIYDCMKKCSPHLARPVWFDRYVQALDSVIDDQGRTVSQKLCFSGPPQHGKTEITKHGLVSWATRAPGLCHAYATYNFDRAREVAEKVKTLAQIAGLNPRLREGTMWLDGGTEIRFVGPGGSLTGNPISGVLVVDDLTKGRADAESKVMRESNWNWFTDDAQTRTHPGSSKIVMATRWHIDDLIGRLKKLLDWPYLRIPAECDSDDDANGRELGEALWEKGRPSSWLQQFKQSPYTWASMYQGRPRPRGDALFGEPTFYTELPSTPFARGYGADLAASEKTRADWSVLLTGQRHEKKVYITNELRKQCQSPEFTDMMKRVVKGRVLWICSGTEKATAQHIRKKVPQFGTRIASTDKYMRATPAAEDGWNVGNILVPDPEICDWSSDFVDEVCGFTGVKDLCDDRVDALAALWLLLGRGDIGEEARSLNQQVKKAVQASQIRQSFRR